LRILSQKFDFIYKMESSEFNRQTQNENIKENILSFMKLNLQNIYKVCSKCCVKDFKNKDLSNKDKICLSKCFDRKSESFQMSMEYLNKYSKAVEEAKDKTFTEEMKFE